MQPKRLLVHSHQMYGQYSDVRSFRFEGLAVLHRFAPLGLHRFAPLGGQSDAKAMQFPSEAYEAL